MQIDKVGAQQTGKLPFLVAGKCAWGGGGGGGTLHLVWFAYAQRNFLIFVSLMDLRESVARLFTGMIN
jgi:hypothetical protein